MNSLAKTIDSIWLKVASVKITMVLLLSLLLLSIPGTLVMQYNISSVDPGLSYEYDFWKFGSALQLFQAYRSFWYVGLIVLLALNLIACSVERWPMMWKLATQKQRPLLKDSIMMRRKEHVFEIKSKKSVAKVIESEAFKKEFPFFTVKDNEKEKHLFFQKGRWSRLSNYVVHTSLLIIFLGAIVSSMYGFEGVVNVAEGSYVDTFLVFGEGNSSGLKDVPKKYKAKALPNEKMLPFRLAVEKFEVSFYKDFPGRPQSFVSDLNVIDRNTGNIVKKQKVLVNEPLEYGDFVFYQANYGKLDAFDLNLRVMDRSEKSSKAPVRVVTDVGQKEKIEEFGAEFAVIQANSNVQDLGPGVRIQEFRNGEAYLEPFWILKDYPLYDKRNRKNSSWIIILDDFREKFFTGLQVAHDPGAPIYWFGCFFMVLGTFYALFVQHRKFYMIFDKQKNSLIFTGSTHRLPYKFEEEFKRYTKKLRKLL